MNRWIALPASLAIASGALVLQGCSSSSTTADTVVVTETVAAAAADAAEAPAQDSAAPAPQNLSGSGMKVTSLNVSRESPVVIKGTHRGESNFIVDVLGGDYPDNAFNEIGNYSGTTVLTGLSLGKHRVRVNADGPWTLKVTQPDPPASPTGIPGAVTGKGSAVVWVRAAEDLEPIITGRHRGESNFIVGLLTPDGSGEENLFNEIGTFTGETTTSIPAGDYLMEVQADGSWSVRFAR